ncbi:MAG: hypothetical protein ACO34C_08225, partial [Candidatus Kapaibacteriota bacterium]
SIRGVISILRAEIALPMIKEIMNNANRMFLCFIEFSPREIQNHFRVSMQCPNSSLLNEDKL